MTQVSPPANYYLDYFQQMVDVVLHRYEDILPSEDLVFFRQFADCSLPAKRLLIRLYLRKGPNFLVNKLKYAEVPEVKSAIAELAEHSLLEANPLVFAYELIDILPIATSRILFNAEPTCRKSDLMELWLDDDTLKTCTEWGVTEEIISPCHYETIRRLQLLYFGNERQTLTEFILEDLGLFKYEQYRLDKSTRLFNQYQDIEQLMQLNDLRAEFYVMNDAKQWQGLTSLAEQALQLNLPNNLHAKWHRFLNRIAYRLEQQGELELAKTIFSSNQQPPARERLVRIHFKQGNFTAAMSLLEQIHHSPKSADEVQFYRRFVNKLHTKLGLAKLDLSPPTLQVIHKAWVKGEGSVEQQALTIFENSVWLENNLPLAIFGLIYWHAIFADVPGVWHHPFQFGPTDLTEPEFCNERALWLNKIEQQSKAQWRDVIELNWQEKNGLRNPFVSWTSLDLDTVLRCFNALSKQQWQGLFNHLLSDIRQYRSGFPDLFQATDSGYRFIEIKGPGDKLQDNQIAWLEKFHELNICADVCYVQYLDA